MIIEKVNISSANFFTAYGGYLTKKELKVGQKVEIWFVGCRRKEAGKPPKAAYVKIVFE